MRSLIAVLLIAPLPALAAGGSLATTSVSKQSGVSQPMRDRLRSALGSDTGGVIRDNTPLHARGLGSMWSAHRGKTTIGEGTVKTDTAHYSHVIPIDNRQQRVRTSERQGVEATQQGPVLELRSLTRTRTAYQGNGYNGYKPEGRDRSVSLRTERVRSMLGGAIQLRTVNERTRKVDVHGKREITETPSRQLIVFGRELGLPSSR